MSPAENTSPEQYFRLILLRLLETQRCLSPLLHSPALAPVRFQYQVNAATLSEIVSWLEARGETSPLGPSPYSAQAAAGNGAVSEAKPQASDTIAGTLVNPFVWNAPRTPRLTESQVLSSLPRNVKLDESASISNGRVIFRLPSLSGKPKDTSPGPQGTLDTEGSGD